MNSEQGSLESFVEAGERLCGPDVGRELGPPLRCQNRDEFRCFSSSGVGGTRRPVLTLRPPREAAVAPVCSPFIYLGH